MDIKRPLGIKIFGIGNIIFSSIFLFTYSIYFLFTVVFGWLSDRELYGIIEWIDLAIINRLDISVVFIFSFLLFKSGIGLVTKNLKARKLAKISSIIIASASLLGIVTSIIVQLIYPDKKQFGLNSWVYFEFLFIIYSFLLTSYLNFPSITQLFNDQNLKISFIRPILVVIISFLFPFIVNLFFPVFPKNLIFRN